MHLKYSNKTHTIIRQICDFCAMTHGYAGDTGGDTGVVDTGVEKVQL